MKALLTGTFRVGKTTLLKEMAGVLPSSYGYIPEVARQLLEQDPSLETNPAFQDILFSEQKRLESSAFLERYPWVLCDRGAVDIVAYSRYFGHPVKKEWLEWAKTYDPVFLLDKNDVPFTNEIFENDAQYEHGRDWIKFRNDIDAQIIAVLNELNFGYVLLSGSVEQRLTMLIDSLK